MTGDLQVGQMVWTPWAPHGLVEIMAIEGPHPVSGKPTCRVRYTHDHAGHTAGTFGRYYVDELLAERPQEE